jgi:hypothetical protein
MMSTGIVNAEFPLPNAEVVLNYSPEYVHTEESDEKKQSISFE